MLCAPGSRQDAVAFIDQVLTDPALLRLVDASCGAGLVRMRKWLGALVGTMPDDEQAQVSRILRQWEALADDPPEPDGDRGRRVAWLGAVARGRWDMRCGQEREAIPASCDILPPDVAGLVDAVARRWGMVRPRAVRGDFDAVILLGGQLGSNLSRSAAAGELLRTGAVTSPLVIGLACQRRLSRAELALSPAGLVTEADAMRFGMTQAFGADGWRDIGPGVREQVLPDGLRLLAAHMPVGARRPTTGESFDWLLATGQLQGAPRLLSITSPLYWIQNHCNLLTRLPVGSTLETVGCRSPRYRSQHYLQEIKAAVDVLPSLLDWAR